MLPGARDSDTSLGGVIGVTGEFHVTRHFDVLVEFAGHWVDFDDSQIFATGLVGAAFHF